MGFYRAAIVERHQRAQEARRARMKAEAERLARAVATRFPMRRLYLYGSVASGRPLSVWSDIDLAVEGLPPDRFLELAGALADSADCRVDLKPIEDLAEDESARIAREGVLLYERS